MQICCFYCCSCQVTAKLLPKYCQVPVTRGTAQKFEEGRIAAGKYVSSFIGFFPADKPEYLALVIVNEPQGAYYGSVVAAPCAKEIFEGIISLKNIQPRG